MPENTPEESKPVYLADIAGRSIKVVRPTETQAALMGRGAIRAERAGRKKDMTAALYAVGDVLDIVESLIAEQDDKDFLTGLMATGKLEVQDVMEAFQEAIMGRNLAPATGVRVTRGGSK